MFAATIFPDTQIVAGVNVYLVVISDKLLLPGTWYGSFFL